MKSIILFLFAYVVTVVSAYGSHGAYERVFYWYAYQVDADVHNGIPQIIAPACKKRGRCTFEEFIRYIEKGQPNVLPKGITGSMRPDKMADMLAAQGFTGTYDGTRLIQGFSDGEQVVTRVMKKIGSKFRKTAFLEAASEKSQVNLSEMRLALRRVHFLRNVEYSQDLKRALEKRDIVVKEKPRAFTYDSRDDPKYVIDMKGTRKANPQTTAEELNNLIQALHGAKGNEGEGTKLDIHGPLLQAVRETMSNLKACP
ncbi:hypothetical protein N7535_003997 [Penicillium sp. DV-2018c]|nr:hypothetical protein N7461_000302 [Penicillium sp. DV-2018c]KAJ5577071.1 hypothetical protein N7535_003997 [Penicillium sp. DV-2018c]